MRKRNVFGKITMVAIGDYMIMQSPETEAQSYLPEPGDRR
jgi:hypothetical protein